MTRTQLYLSDSQYEELKKMASAGGQTFAGLVRGFLEEKMREVKEKKPKNKQQGALARMAASLKKVEQWKEKGVVRNGSTHHDDYLYTS